MRRALLAALLCAGCVTDPGTLPLGEAQRSWERALRAARDAGWPFAQVAAVRAQIEKTPGAGRRPLCDIAYDLADTGCPPEGGAAVIAACAAALEAGTPGDPLAAAMQISARAGYPPDVMVQTAGILAEVQAKHQRLQAGAEALADGEERKQALARVPWPKDLVRVLDRAAVFKTPPWTALQFLKDMAASLEAAPLDAQVDLFEEALGRKGRHLEAQAVLAAFRDAVLAGFPSGDLSAACRFKLRRGMSPARLPSFLQEIGQWPVPPLPRPQALRLIAAGLAHGMPDEEVAALGGFVARSAMDARDAALLAFRVEEGIRGGLKGQRLLAESLQNFSGARLSAPAAR